MTCEPFLSARAAARFAGFDPDDANSARDDREMRRFYEWVRVRRVPKHRRGPRQLVFRASELEAAIAASSTPESPAAVAETYSHIEELARAHVLQAIRGGKR